MEPNDNRHGTYKGSQKHHYDDERPCEPCRLAGNRYRVRWDKERQLKGALPRVVDGTPAALHVQTLIAAGMTAGLIAERSGVSRATVETVRAGIRPRLRRDNANALLGVSHEPMPTGTVPSIGSVRRVQALAMLGWTYADIANRGPDSLQRATIARFMCGPKFVRVETRDSIRAVYDELSMTVPPPSRDASTARRRAQQKGWAPALSWSNIDDATETPTGIYDPSRVLPHTAHRADTLHDLDARAGGLSEALRLLDINTDALEKWCERHELSPLFNRLRGRETAIFQYRNGTTGAA